MVDKILDGPAQWRCVNGECHRKNNCEVFMPDGEIFYSGWVKFFKAYPPGDNCYHWKPKEDANGNPKESSD